MNLFNFLFHLNVVNHPDYLTSNDDQDILLTLEANRLCWDYLPEEHPNKVAYATGYLMAREALGRDLAAPVGANPSYDRGYERGQLVIQGAQPQPIWDPALQVS